MTRHASRGRANDFDDGAFPDDFRDFIAALNAAKVEYVLVGGYAVGVHGHIRATSDIDFFYRRTAANARRLIRALGAFGAPPDVMDAEHLLRPESVSAFGSPPMRIDLLASISGVTFDDAVYDQLHVEIAGESLPVIGLAALRANKRASGRRKDKDDLRHLPLPPTR